MQKETAQVMRESSAIGTQQSAHKEAAFISCARLYELHEHVVIVQGGPKNMLFWAQHIFWPRPFGVVLHAKIDLWGPLGASGRGQKAYFFIFFEHIFWSSLSTGERSEPRKGFKNMRKSTGERSEPRVGSKNNKKLQKKVTNINHQY